MALRRLRARFTAPDGIPDLRLDGAAHGRESCARSTSARPFPDIRRATVCRRFAPARSAAASRSARSSDSRRCPHCRYRLWNRADVAISGARRSRRRRGGSVARGAARWARLPRALRHRSRAVRRNGSPSAGTETGLIRRRVLVRGPASHERVRADAFARSPRWRGPAALSSSASTTRLRESRSACVAPSRG